ncbi:hypothetical protein QIS74_03409 [Colletotrichum tabaci]|uniref:LysM domain-containing protein n=1 Tax=Colletotrichum tabaci TaxID=1209068 RepID=A0AAV9TK80_9PEZI
MSVGDVVFRAFDESDEEVSDGICKDIADFYWIDVDFFFILNPGLERDCSNIQSNTEYCTDGWIEPVRDPDGLCGHLFRRASIMETPSTVPTANTAPRTEQPAARRLMGGLLQLGGL